MRSLLFVLFAFLAFGASAADDDDCYPPKPNRLVVDMLGKLSPQESASLEAKLQALNTKTSNQVVIVILDKLCAGDAAMTAYEIGERWEVGQKGLDNGIVILVKPTGGPGERRTFIATGRGLEGAIPDATGKLIVDKEMIPHFRNDNYYAGLDAAVDILAELATGEYSFEDYQNAGAPSPLAIFLPMLLIFLFWIFLSYRRVNKYASTNSLGFWAALALMNASSRSHSGHYGSFRSGSGGFGGGGGGGFGGFGGGSFGGGGAGGSW